MPTHTPAPADVVDLVRERIASGHYPDLVEAEVTINVLFASPTGPGPAVKLHGYPCAAVIRINSERDRIEGKADATLTIDGNAWRDVWSDEEKVALIDHELHHLVVRRNRPTKRNPDPYILSDDAGRPKLRMRLHDYQIGGFAAIAERHGEASFEVKVANQIRDEYGQLLWDFATAPGERSGRRRATVPMVASATA